jgi:hypothetical protein
MNSGGSYGSILGGEYTVLLAGRVGLRPPGGGGALFGELPFRLDAVGGIRFEVVGGRLSTEGGGAVGGAATVSRGDSPEGSSCLPVGRGEISRVLASRRAAMAL